METPNLLVPSGYIDQYSDTFAHSSTRLIVENVRWLSKVGHILDPRANEATVVNFRRAVHLVQTRDSLSNKVEG